MKIDVTQTLNRRSLERVEILLSTVIYNLIYAGEQTVWHLLLQCGPLFSIPPLTVFVESRDLQFC